jgi:hypothetical protein
MELLDQLELKVEDLLKRLSEVNSGGAELESLRVRCRDLEAENKSLTDTLELERRSNKTVLMRVDQLLARLKAERESGGL